MSLPLKSQQDLYNLFITVLQDNAPNLTDVLDGSTIDAMAGVFSIAGTELQRQTVQAFNKTFIDLANGPAITGGADDLQTLAVDHYGAAFARPGAVSAVDTETFSRPYSSVATYGAVSIISGAIVKTSPDANGNSQRYATDSLISLTAAGFTFTCLSASASIGAIYSNNGQQFTIKTNLVAGTSLHAYGTGLPLASGTLTKVSGTGDATITFSAYSVPSSDTSVSIGVEAVVAGASGNAAPGVISVIETTLLDPTILCSNTGNATGENSQDDATYRETIRNLIVSLRAATAAAIKAIALTVPGVVIASTVQIETPVVFWNPATNLPLNPAVAGLYEYFLIPFATLYVADSAGSANQALINAVQTAIAPYRAFGVFINVVGATPITVDWSGVIVLNPSGPNFALFSEDTSEIVASMSNYIATLGTGVSFVRADATAAILAIWGAAGTNDLTSFTTTVPTGDVTIGVNQNAIPGTVKTV